MRSGQIYTPTETPHTTTSHLLDCQGVEVDAQPRLNDQNRAINACALNLEPGERSKQALCLVGVLGDPPELHTGGPTSAIGLMMMAVREGNMKKVMRGLWYGLTSAPRSIIPICISKTSAGFPGTLA